MNVEQQSDGLKVMMTDDSKAIRHTIKTLLRKVGYDMITAIDGFDTLMRIADARPNIIFIGIMMPHLNDYQTCAPIKDNGAFKSAPVIMLSSRDGLFDRAKGRTVNSDQYLAKPFNRGELLGTVKTHVPGFAPVDAVS